jgi:hypothetical protein
MCENIKINREEEEEKMDQINIFLNEMRVD